ncbi:MAG: hypothetical protein K2F83_06150, partial [Oscillospiraceae bacterium]|nr:hypothetical protein [Oscillospiraceae bacterium]
DSGTLHLLHLSFHFSLILPLFRLQNIIPKTFQRVKENAGTSKEKAPARKNRAGAGSLIWGKAFFGA